MNLFNGRLLDTPVRAENRVACCDHEFEYHSDWYGDPGVIGGTCDCSYYECTLCGKQEGGDPPDYSWLD